MFQELEMIQGGWIQETMGMQGRRRKNCRGQGEFGLHPWINEKTLGDFKKTKIKVVKKGPFDHCV